LNPNFQKSNKNNNRVITKNLNYCQNWNWFYLYTKQFKIFLLMDEILLLKNKFFATKTIEWFESIKALVSVVFLTNNLITKNQQKIKKKSKSFKHNIIQLWVSLTSWVYAKHNMHWKSTFWKLPLLGILCILRTTPLSHQ
jgi:hypothetical protein